ncbi:hypothetical protein evm_011446 [Chilo suppressalis]|nr:hypothetical protein evm_011446 [Chilo suppressalis]
MALLHKSPALFIPDSTEDSIKKAKEMKKPQRKMYIPIKIQTNAIKKDDIAINATYISIEDLTNEEERKKARQRARNVEVRYLDSIRNIRDKIKSSYSCNKEQCPMVKERLVQHQIEHHSSNSPHQCHRRSQTTLQQTEPESISVGTINHFETADAYLKKSVATSPKPSILKRAIVPKHSENQSMQTTPTFIDFNHPAQSYVSRLTKNDVQTNLNYNDLDKTEEFIPTENKISFTTSTNCVMKDDLRNVVMKWHEDIPVYPNFSLSVKNLRKTLINEFVEKIYSHINEENTDEEYENKVKLEIDDLLNTLPMWYPGAKKDQEMLKDNIKNNLIIKIKELRSKVDYEKITNTQMDERVGKNGHTNLTNQFQNENVVKLIENEIIDWLMQIKFKESEDIGRTINIIDTTDIFAKRLMPLLNKPVCTRNYKLILKSVIVETLNSLPNVFQYPKNKRLYLNRIAEELTNRLLYIQVKCKDSSSCQFLRDRKMYQMTVSSNSDIKRSSLNRMDCFNPYTLGPRFHIIEDVTDILADCIESISFDDIYKGNNASHTRQNSIESSETQTSIEVSDAIVESIRDTLTEDIINDAQYSNNSIRRSCLTNTVSVYKSEQDLSRQSNFPVTSTPKRKTNKTEINKQNPEEIAYSKTISDIIRGWMKTLPKNFHDDKKFKDTVIMDLTGDIVDQIKTEQLVHLSDIDKNKIMYYTIFRWLYRFDIFEDNLSEDIPQIRDLINCLSQVPVPDLTRPRHGNRQTMANAKMKESKRDFFVPMGTDVLKDEISIWINEHSNINLKADVSNRSRMVEELANLLQNCLVNKRSETEINNVISNWLKKTMKSTEMENIDKFTETLKNRIVKLPQDDTLAKNLHIKIYRKLEAEGNANAANPRQVSIMTHDLNDDRDETMKEFIAKYMEHNYDVDDTIARGAFTELLKTEIRKLNPPTRKEVYDKFTKPHDELSTDRLDKELQYIKIVSDWLKNIPIDNSFNTPHNRNRIEIVNDLARNIYEVEEERRRAPTAMDYDMYLASIISQFTNVLPIPPEHKGNVMFMIDELIGRIVSDRTPIICCQHPNQSDISKNTTGIQEQNISEFIHHYIHLNAGEFGDDQMKLDAWSSRLMKEVKKIIQQTADPSTLCKTQVYNKLINIPLPEHESVRLFGLELGYAKEISDWLKNLPLLPLQTQEANDQRVSIISELAEKFSEWDRKKITDPSSAPSNTNIEEFITQWIKRIPLEPKKEIDISILIPQLLRRIENINKGSEVSTLESTKIENLSPVKPNKSKFRINKSRSKAQKCRPSCCGFDNSKAGQVIVDAIENWSNSLPLRSHNKYSNKSSKDDIARKLYQKVGDLSVDPQIMNDDSLFQVLFEDEVNTVLSHLDQDPNIQKKKETLKNDLIEKVMEAKSIVQEAVAGGTYKLLLENTIEASIPNPKSNKQWYDPGFEIYKNRLADMFILDNFDHGNDAVKMKYERKIRHEVDKYFESAQNRNAAPIGKDEIYNELYSALFKVRVPNEASAVAEVEEVKTRCEIDIWFEGLPIREPTDLSELLEWDKILSMLAKRLHAMEKNGQSSEGKMHKEIAKWIIRFPLLGGEEYSVDKFAEDLQNRLKTSKEDRKCVTSSSKGKEIKKVAKRKGSFGNKSQIPGPSSKGQIWKSNNELSQTCCQLSADARKKPAELVLETVETWCERLPLPIITAQDEINNKIIRDNLLTQIIIKICALNGDPQTFNDVILYQYFLDVELDNLLTKVPICCQFENTKKYKKSQLIGAILQILPLMREEKACYEYKKELKSIINTVLEEPLDTTAEKVALFNKLKDEIVENYVQLHYYRDDDEGKQIYKANLHEIVSKYLQNIRDKSDISSMDSLMKQNQLTCELAKVPIPCERVIKDQVEEIRMREEVQEFFDSLDLPEESEDKIALRNTIATSLSKRLKDIEQAGHNCENDSKMKKEIERCIKKINLEVAPEKIEDFVNTLKDNEAIRKTPPHKTSASQVLPNHLDSNHSDKRPNTGQNSGMKDWSSDKRSLNPPSEYKEFGGVHIPTSSSLSNQEGQQCNNQISTTVPTIKTPDGHENSLNQPQRYAQRQNNKKQGRNSDDEVANEVCKCESRIKSRLRVRPRCVLRRKDYCEECDQFGWIPMPYRMPLPRCYFY